MARERLVSLPDLITRLRLKQEFPNVTSVVTLQDSILRPQSFRLCDHSL
jgi:hypothetical protein